MGKFDGILLCTDLDGTLLDDQRYVSPENTTAIEYFKKEGGKFTFVTGRVPRGARLMLDFIHPNAPVVAFNGAGIYDFDDNKLLWGLYLDESAKSAIAYVEERVPGLGLAICTDENVHFSKMNEWVDAYFKAENLPLDTTPYMEIQEQWKKGLFIADSSDMPKIRQVIAESPFSQMYDFVQSSPNYYEILPKGATKGTGLRRLTELLGIDKEKVIAVGDNENDIPMIKEAKVGIAVANAIDDLKDAADIVTVSNNEHAIKKVIDMLDNGEIYI